MGKEIPHAIGDLVRLFCLPVSTVRQILRFTPRRDSATSGELARGMVRALADRYTSWRRWPVDKHASMCYTRGLKTKKAGSLATVGSPRLSVDPRIITPGARADSH